MQQYLSAVIICKNEEHIIGKTIASAKRVAAEVLVYDTGSMDATISIVQGLNVRLVQASWEGYGPSKQKAIAAATHDWVLNIDADEVLNEDLIEAINKLTFESENTAYKCSFRNFLGNRCLKYGEFGFDAHIRLFNRKAVSWNDAGVHERLLLSDGMIVQKLRGAIHHYTMKDTQEFVHKTVNYALLNAEEYYRRGKKASWIKQFIAPAFMFLKYYVLRLGFLDGWAGLFAARMAGLYTYLKYTRLRELSQINMKQTD